MKRTLTCSPNNYECLFLNVSLLSQQPFRRDEGTCDTLKHAEYYFLNLHCMMLMNVFWMQMYVSSVVCQSLSSVCLLFKISLSYVNPFKDCNNSTAVVCWWIIHSLISAGFRSSVSSLWPVCCSDAALKLQPQTHWQNSHECTKSALIDATDKAKLWFSVCFADSGLLVGFVYKPESRMEGLHDSFSNLLSWLKSCSVDDIFPEHHGAGSDPELHNNPLRFKQTSWHETVSSSNHNKIKK